MVSKSAGVRRGSLPTKQNSIQDEKENVHASTDELPEINQGIGTLGAEKINRNVSAPSGARQRRLSLPQINSSSILSQGNNNNEKIKTVKPQVQRRISLPIIQPKNVVFTQVLKVNHENEDTMEQRHYIKENNNNGNGPQDDGQIFTKRKRRDSTHHATVFTPASRDRRRSSYRPDTDTLQLNTAENMSSEPLYENEEHNGILGKNFQHASHVVGKAALFAKFLGDEFNTRYLHATLYDPDYNDKYHRIPTPEIETDEENEEAILRDFAARLAGFIESPTEHTDVDGNNSDSEGSDSSQSVENHESNGSDSEQSLIRIDEVPVELRGLIDLDKINKPDQEDILLELGIWKANDFINNDQDADDEESEDDWSIKTFEDHEEEDEILDFPATPLPTPPPPPKSITPPHFVKLPKGDTPDILHIPSESEETPSSSYSIYASEFDEYESDVFGIRLQENLFFVPHSLHSDAGDSDIFYCVPSPIANCKVLSTTSEQKTQDNNNVKNDEGILRSKKQKRKRRKELDEIFVQNFMVRHRVHDATIQQFGGATKAFRLRMAKLGKDPVREDDKRNERIEEKVRRRLARGNRKRKKLTKENVIKLPNVSKKAKVMRWINIQKKGQNSNVIFENGWMSNSDLASSMRVVDGDLRKTLTKKQSLRMRSIDDEASPTPQNEAKEKHFFKTAREESKVIGDIKKANATEKHGDKKKKVKRKHKKRKIEIAKSEDSFAIIKNMDIKIVKKKNDNEDSDVIEDISPQSDKESFIDKNNDSISCDSDDSIIPHESPLPPATGRKRFPTPESEPEPEPEIDQSDEERKQNEQLQQQAQKRKRAASLSWKMLRPKLKFGKRWENYNPQFAEVTRMLFSQLSLKTKDYSKLPPIRKRSRVSPFSTNKSGRSSTRRRDTINSTAQRSKNYSALSSTSEKNKV